MTPITILIADDHAPFRKGLLALFAATPDTTLVGEAATGAEAVALAAERQPDVILMDLHMPGLNGIEATRKILATSPHIGILVLTMFDDDASVFAAMQAGARGYLLKGVLKAEILRAVRTVASGEAIFGPAIAVRLMNYFAALRDPKGFRNPLGLNAFPELTEREWEILALLAQHLTNPEIAERLGLSPKTIRNHVSTIPSTSFRRPTATRPSCGRARRGWGERGNPSLRSGQAVGAGERWSGAAVAGAGRECRSERAGRGAARHPGAGAIVAGVPAPQRAASSPGAGHAGRLLAALGDPRPGVGLRADGLPDIAWVRLEGGDFPWGAEWDETKANTSETEPFHTGAVGIYPQGATPEGIHDLAGNVWEWIAPLGKPGEVDITAARVLRGGSWYFDSQYARAGSRLRLLPGVRYDYWGFRLVGPAVVALDSGQSVL